ncbi:MAG: DNA replication/repair protein RecF [Oscillospiraceae bacterium]|jgi:DNA replication and repair protein RecF|nr:DNA replication/repair protein RecF [Oscillospiraceae bacterium]
MRVIRAELRAFRNYASVTFEPDAGITVLCGRNAQGKTNLLEAVVLCSVGQSHRTNHDRELIHWDAPRASVSLETERRDGTHDVKIILNRGGGMRVKQVLIGASPALRIGELMGHVPSVLFSPEDLSLVKEGPGERRRFMDMALSQLRPQYFYSLQQYSRALKQRNGLLRALSVSSATASEAASQLEPWDEILSQTGALIIRHRVWFLDRLVRDARDAHAHLSGSNETLAARFICPFDKEDDVVRALLEALRNERARDLTSRGTNTGPHRDDFELTLNGKPARVYGSQGQQRTAALALKLAAFATIRDELDDSPVLLLDDVMSELDAERRCRLLSWTPGVQMIITCTDESDLAGAAVGKMYMVDNGTIV